MTGWLSIHRKIKDNVVFSDPYLFKLWMLCLMKATHTEHDQLAGNQVIKLQPGQFLTGRHALSEEYNRGAVPSDVVNSLTIFRWLKKLEKMEMLNIKSTNKYSIVSISKWNEYQGIEQQMNNKRTSNEHQMNTNNNGNKGNNENKNKDSSRKQVYDEESEPYILANYLFERIQKNIPDLKKPNLQKWSDEMRKLMEIDGKDKSQIARVIKWAQQDSFEMTNVLSATKLRKRYNELLLKMQHTGEKNVSKQQVKKEPVDYEKYV